MEESEGVFRKLGLPGFITAMDAVHMAYDRAPFPARHLFMGKEGYPTVGVNVHSNAVGWVKHVGSIFPGAHNDKTAVQFDKLVSAMRNDALFTSCESETSVPASNGENFKLHGCMALCDSGYHRWRETMCAMKYPTSVNDARFSSRFRCMRYSITLRVTFTSTHQTLTHGCAHTHVYGRCESVRKIIERVFGMLKKRFRILRLPMLVKDMAEVEDIVKVCCVLHNMCLQVHEYTYIPTRHTHT